MSLILNSYANADLEQIKNQFNSLDTEVQQHINIHFNCSPLLGPGTAYDQAFNNIQMDLTSIINRQVDQDAIMSKMIDHIRNLTEIALDGKEELYKEIIKNIGDM